MVTIKDIARECNVSIATVSNVLNGKNKASVETQNRIMEVVEKFGYTPNRVAKGLRSKKTDIIGIIVEDLSQFTTANIVEGVMRQIEEYGYKAVLINLRLYSRWSDKWFHNEDMLNEVLDQSIEDLGSIMVDGIVYVAVHARVTHKLSGKLGVPAVMVYAYESDGSIPSVVIDDELSAYNEINYLIEKGHKDIGIIGGRQDNMHTQLRLKGALRAFEEHGIKLSDDRICYALWGKKEGYEAAKLLEGKGLTAIFCMADRMAGGVYQYAYEKGIKIGQDFSLVGYDDQIVADYFNPGLTTMALPLHALGKTAADIIMERLGETETHIEITDNLIKIPCTFIERESVADIN